MFRVGVNDSGSSTQRTLITLSQALELFENFSNLRIPSDTEPDIDYDGPYQDIVVELSEMDSTAKK